MGRWTARSVGLVMVGWSVLIGGSATAADSADPDTVTAFLDAADGLEPDAGAAASWEAEPAAETEPVTDDGWGATTATDGWDEAPGGLSADDRDAIGRIVYAEAGNQGEEGLVAVIFTILNRVNSGLFQDSVQAVIDAPNQFEPATRAGGWRALPPLDAARAQHIDGLLDRIVTGDLADPTGGALYFQNVQVVAARAARGVGSAYLIDFGGTPPIAVIGDHSFYDAQAGINLAAARLLRDAADAAYVPPEDAAAADAIAADPLAALAAADAGWESTIASEVVADTGAGGFEDTGAAEEFIAAGELPETAGTW